LAEQARGNLEAAAIRNALVVSGDGTLGLAEHAPYDAIITCAAAPRVPPRLVEQLAEGGRLVHPLGGADGEEVLAYRKRGGALLVERRIVHAYFVPMKGSV
jgi:protein-L-isoaspartate(D-aspartate) O-methyltransferase